MWIFSPDICKIIYNKRHIRHWTNKIEITCQGKGGQQPHRQTASTFTASPGEVPVSWCASPHLTEISLHEERPGAKPEELSQEYRCYKSLAAIPGDLVTKFPPQGASHSLVGVGTERRDNRAWSRISGRDGNSKGRGSTLLQRLSVPCLLPLSPCLCHNGPCR